MVMDYDFICAGNINTSVVFKVARFLYDKLGAWDLLDRERSEKV